MSLPTPINWLRRVVAVPSLFPETNTGQAIMLFHTDNFVDNDGELASLIRSCVFHANSEYNDIWYEGIIKESDREKVQEFIAMDEKFQEYAKAYEPRSESGISPTEFGWSPNWVWITDTLMRLYDKLEFTDQSNEKDVRFWMLVQNYQFDEYSGSLETGGMLTKIEHYNRQGNCHMILIETENLENWDPQVRENLEISGPNGVFEFDLPSWIYGLGTTDDED